MPGCYCCGSDVEWRIWFKQGHPFCGKCFDKRKKFYDGLTDKQVIFLAKFFHYCMSPMDIDGYLGGGQYAPLRITKKYVKLFKTVRGW